MHPKISIVTVCFNSEKTIERTIKSVAAQDYSNLEYVIIDGASKDTTLDIIKNNSSNVSNYISEPDKGIYDAMNKGYKTATGEFVLFLNSDDWFTDTNVISRMANEIRDLNQMYHGKLSYRHFDGKVTVMGGPVQISDLKYGLRNLHQPATLFPRHFFEEMGGFNLNYRVAADYDLMRRFLKAKPSSFVDVIVTTMSDGGASSKLIDTVIRENAAIAISFGESTVKVRSRAVWVRFWLRIRYNYPRIYWFFKHVKAILR